MSNHRAFVLAPRRVIGLMAMISAVSACSGCGASSGDRKTVCAHVVAGMETFDADLATFSASPTSTEAQNEMASATNSLKTSVSELRSSSGKSEQSMVSQYADLLTRFEQSVRSAAAGNFSEGSGDLVGIADEIHGLTREIKASCR